MLLLIVVLTPFQLGTGDNQSAKSVSRFTVVS